MEYHAHIDQRIARFALDHIKEWSSLTPALSTHPASVSPSAAAHTAPSPSDTPSHQNDLPYLDTPDEYALFLGICYHTVGNYEMSRTCLKDTYVKLSTWIRLRLIKNQSPHHDFMRLSRAQKAKAEANAKSENWSWNRYGWVEVPEEEWQIFYRRVLEKRGNTVEMIDVEEGRKGSGEEERNERKEIRHDEDEMEVDALVGGGDMELDAAFSGGDGETGGGADSDFVRDYSEEELEQEHEDKSEIIDKLSIEDMPPLDYVALPAEILIRKCYVELFDNIFGYGLKSPSCGIIIIGEPGSGKTMCLPYLLVCLLEYDQSVLFSLDGSQLLFFHFGKVYQPAPGHTHQDLRLPKPKSASSGVFLWSLFDTGGKREPLPLLTNTRLFPVQTTAPDTSRYKEWQKHRSASYAAFPKWTRAELLQGLRLQTGFPGFLSALNSFYANPDTSNDLSDFPGTLQLLEERANPVFQDSPQHSVNQAIEYLVDKAIEAFGFSARDVYDGVFDFAGANEALDENIPNISSSQLRNLGCSFATSDLGFKSPDISHRILAFYPDSLHRGRTVPWRMSFKSTYIMQQFFDFLNRENSRKSLELLSHYRTTPAMGTAAGQLFELFAHRTLGDKDSRKVWALEEMRGDKSNNPTFVIGSSSKSKVEFPGVQLPSVKFCDVDLENPLLSGAYYQPLIPNYSLFDAFTFNIRGGSADLWLFQMTVSDKHKGSAEGYLKVRNIMRNIVNQIRAAQVPEKHKRKLVVVVRYVLVVPEDEENLQWSFPVGWKDNITQVDHRGKVYCLRIPLVENQEESH